MRCIKLRGIDQVDRKELFSLLEESITRAIRFKIRGRRFRGDLRKNFFTQRVVGTWNSLPVEAGTLTTFKKHLDEHLKCHSIQGYGPSAGK